MMKKTRVYKLSGAQIARLAALAVSDEWLTFTALAIGGVEFACNLNGADGEEVLFIREGTIFEPSGD